MYNTRSQPQVITFTSCLPMVGGSFRVLQASATTKTGRHDITEILLKVALNTKKSIKSKYNTRLERGVNKSNSMNSV